MKWSKRTRAVEDNGVVVVGGVLQRYWTVESVLSRWLRAGRHRKVKKQFEFSKFFLVIFFLWI